jgi:hypothetical protein
MSYTWQDAEPALRIADALRAATIEEWLGQSEPRGARLHKFGRQIRICAICLPIVSAPSQSRPEDYFQLESKHAADRTQDAYS